VPDSLFRFGTGLGKLDRINRGADPSCSGIPAVNLSQEIPRSVGQIVKDRVLSLR